MHVTWEKAVRASGVSIAPYMEGFMEDRRKERGTYPRSVRQMFMRRSAPQPAMRKTPTGGTEKRMGQ